jgi:hypothetical protein
MKIRVSVLKRLIREAVIAERKISPSLFQNNKAVSDPFEKQNLSQALGTLEKEISTTLSNNLVLSMQDQYDPETREFSDEAFDKIVAVVDGTTEKIVSKVAAAIKSGWVEAHGAVKAETKR